MIHTNKFSTENESLSFGIKTKIKGIIKYQTNIDMIDVNIEQMTGNKTSNIEICLTKFQWQSLIEEVQNIISKHEINEFEKVFFESFNKITPEELVVELESDGVEFEDLIIEELEKVEDELNDKSYVVLAQLMQTDYNEVWTVSNSTALLKHCYEASFFSDKVIYEEFVEKFKDLHIKEMINKLNDCGSHYRFELK